ncbi:Glutamine-dependent NAD(+) synthetase [Oopsacas minuta]|uniref:Glutamine-dependent NAD(+) synthetase n=1 Tax=Oopsacas minuta TaxID=111878 RepID=A0AAV7KA15_9METZ|nr:Glutamine-dependent NAD(+) synthetase [Oopsacas minuta]
MLKRTVLATCTLNQWVLDFEGNFQRIHESIRIAKERGARYRLGPELEVTGYSCDDHFLEADTYNHSYDVLARLLKSKVCYDVICDVGMPVMHAGTNYNCRVIFLNGKILLIRPKTSLAIAGNYREGRWFSSWAQHPHMDEFILPSSLVEATGQHRVPFGTAILITEDTSIGSEICQELFNSNSPHIAMTSQGVEIITNGSSSHHQLRKLNTRYSLMQAATLKTGCVYMYANTRGCDGERVYFDGASMIFLNGELLAIGSQFSLEEIEVVTSTINLDEIRSFRSNLKSTGLPLSSDLYSKIYVPFSVSTSCSLSPSLPIQIQYHTPAEEIGMGPACWCWDYLRRSRQRGFLLPLSGGIDSSSTAVIIANMCELVFESFQAGDTRVQRDLKRIITGDPASEYIPLDAKDICGKLLTTLYMATKNSSQETQDRAKNLSSDIGSTFIVVNIDKTVDSLVEGFSQVTQKEPKFSAHGGSKSENLALQNIQARSRMVYAYMFAQLSPWAAGKGGSYLVLGSANVDECLFGYLTKYDCSSADINPIGGINKIDLRGFILTKQDKYPSLKSVYNADPTAELEPITKEYTQTDEADMGLTYEELGDIGRERKIKNCGPVGVFTNLVPRWQHKYTPKETADKVKHFFRAYSINRHKATVLTPSYHAENYSPEDNRFDLRPFLYNTDWEHQFDLIDRIANSLQSHYNKSSQPLPSILKSKPDISNITSSSSEVRAPQNILTSPVKSTPVIPTPSKVKFTSDSTTPDLKTTPTAPKSILPAKKVSQI